jgi:tetratricopeptide (TPR) repeat protein
VDLAASSTGADERHCAAVAALAAGRVELARQHVERALAAQPDDPWTLCLAADQALRAGDIERAFQLTRRALARRRDIPRLHLVAGCVHEARGKLDLAVAHHRRAVQLNPAFAEAWNNLGTAFLTKGQHPEAIAHFRTALRASPRDAVLHENLGEALRRQGALQEARRAFQTALKTRLLGGLRSLLRPAPQISAAAYFEGGADGAAGPQTAGAGRPRSEAPWHYELGLALVADGQHDEAAAALQDGLDLEPCLAGNRPSLAPAQFVPSVFAQPLRELGTLQAALGLYGSLIGHAGASRERRASLLHQLRSCLDPVRDDEYSALARLRLGLLCAGFAGSSEKAWLRTVFEALALPWLREALAGGRASLALHLEAYIYEAYVKPTETQAHFRAAFESWLPQMRAAGARAAAAPQRPRGATAIGFFLHRASSGAHVQVLSAALHGMSSEALAQHTPRLYVFSGRAAELDPQLRALGLPVRYLEEERQEAGWDWFARLKRLQAMLENDGVGTLIWVSLALMMPFAFAMRIAPVQVWWALKYHGLEFTEIDGYLTCGGAGGTRRLEGREWRIAPLGAARLFDPLLAPQAAAVRKHYPVHDLLLGCFGREEKLANEEFLESVARVLRACPGAGFLWTGRSRSPVVQEHLERLGVADRCHFIGWVNTQLYAQVIDVFLDSFPFPCGYTLYEAMAAGKPAVLLAGRETDRTGLHAIVGPLLRGETGTAAERESVRAIFGAGGESLYLCAQTPEQYVAHALRLAGSATLRAAAGAANRRFVVEHLSDRRAMAQWFCRHIEEIGQAARAISRASH